MAGLTSTTIAGSYERLLILPAGGLNGTTLVATTDGDTDTTSALSVATTSIAVGATNKIRLDGSSSGDTYIVESGADVLDFYVGAANMLKLTESTLDTIAMIGNTTLTHTVTTAASTPIGLLIDSNTSGDAAQNSVGLHVDFDRTVAGASTNAHNDIGINLDVNSASLGTSSLVGMDIDVVGATSGTSTATGLAVTVGSADTNYAALFTGGNVGIGTAAPQAPLHIEKNSATTVQNTNELSDFNLLLRNNNITQNSFAGIAFDCSTETDADSISAAIYAIRYGSDESTAFHKSEMIFAVNAAGVADDALNEKMRINRDGNIGIGTDSPDTLVEAESASHAGIQINTTDANTISYFSAKNDAVAWQFRTDGGSSDSLMMYLDGTGSKMTITTAGNVGIGGVSLDAHLEVEKLDIDSRDYTVLDDYYGIASNHKYVGASSYEFGIDDIMYGVYSDLQFADVIGGGGFGALFSGYFRTNVDETGLTTSGDAYGLYGECQVETGAELDQAYGAKIVADIDGGTVDESVFGLAVNVDVAGGTMSDNLFATTIDFTTSVNPGGNCWGLNLNMGGAGVDATGDTFFRCYDTSNSDTVALITALAGVATFDSGDFSGAPDYAEYFESKDGNAIAVGKTVKLDGDKVVACSEGDTPIGVVRPDGVGTSAYKAGAQNLRWHGKYLYDDFNELQHEDYEVVEWTEEITFDEYIARGKDETGGVLGGHVKDEKVEGSKAIHAKDAVTQQKTVDEEVEEEVTTTEVVLEDGKYVQKTTTETVTKTVKVPQYDEVDLYDGDGEVIGKHQVPIMETVEEAVAGVDAVPDTYTRRHNYHSDRIPDGITVPDDAETPTVHHKRKKLNPDYDYSKHDDYKARSERDEWSLVGLLGQIPITKGQPLADNWVKMKDVSDTVEMYFVK
jgi:hypothetical protein